MYLIRKEGESGTVYIGVYGYEVRNLRRGIVSERCFETRGRAEGVARYRQLKSRAQFTVVRVPDYVLI